MGTLWCTLNLCWRNLSSKLAGFAIAANAMTSVSFAATFYALCCVRRGRPRSRHLIYAPMPSQGLSRPPPLCSGEAPGGFECPSFEWAASNVAEFMVFQSAGSHWVITIPCRMLARHFLKSFGGSVPRATHASKSTHTVACVANAAPSRFAPA